MDKKRADQQASPEQKSCGNYSTSCRRAEIIERTRDGHAVLVRCPYCGRLHIHTAPSDADPLRLRQAVCDQARTYILGGDV
ncbi:hypothetical protein [Saccharospirillum sp.]|uniref:hypothetical protein n=1 Tax=Saccharospirillum sp. TaxID=2033801 RepID=UPI00349FDB3D